MIKNTSFKSCLLLLSINLITSCSTPVAIEPTNSKTDTQSSNSATVSPSSRDESKKPEPYISGNSGASNSEDSSVKESVSKPMAPSLSSGIEPTIIADGSASAPRPAATSAPSYAPSGATGATSDIASTGGVTSSSGAGGTLSSMPVAPAKRLSAGDTDDNLKFSDYLSYLNSITGLSNEDVIKMDVSDRYILSVKDEDGKSIPDALVQISANGSNVFNSKTYSNGKTLFMPSSIKNINSNCQQQNCNSGYTVTVQKGNEKVSKEFAASQENKNWEIKLNSKKELSNTINLDLAFLVDATGSMGDEISSIQKTIKDIASRINQVSDKQLKIRYSLISYKDKSDSYRVKRYDFTTNLGAYQEILNDLTAGGGGDYKEALNEGLDNAVSKITWTSNTDAVRLIFLIADAPAHLDYQDDVKYPDSIKEAVKQGIKIYPVAASGLDNAGEYIFRQLAQFTYAKFLFLTYGGDEQTPGTTTHHVDTYSQTNLDDLVVNIVKEEITEFSEK